MIEVPTLSLFVGRIRWNAVREAYDDRVSVHRKLLRLLKDNKHEDFVDILLGISDALGNFSAHDHHLGPKILGGNWEAERRIITLARNFLAAKNGHEIPPLIREAGLSYLGIGVGSEASCMLNPKKCWLTNTRTIWMHLVDKHKNLPDAERELELYHDDDTSSEMTYTNWQALHTDLAASMPRIAEEGARLARRARVVPGTITFLWADAISGFLYALEDKVSQDVRQKE